MIYLRKKQVPTRDKRNLQAYGVLEGEEGS